MSPAPLMLSFLISNKLDPTASITSTSWVTAACPALRSIRSSANAIVTRQAGIVTAVSKASSTGPLAAYVGLKIGQPRRVPFL